jgi:hypothetical protein
MGKYHKMPMRVKMTTPKHAEGFGISYSEELRAVNAMLDILPREYSIEIAWYQVLDADVKWIIDHENKHLDIMYNQNLRHWQPHLIKAIYENIVQKYGQPRQKRKHTKTRKRDTGRDTRLSR